MWQIVRTWVAVALGAGLLTGVGAMTPVGTTAAATTASGPLLHPNHPLGGKPGGGGKPGHGGGGTSSPWPGWQSSNWSGYAVTTSSTAPFISITGNWTVPSVSPTKKATYSAAWAGIDGFNNTSLIQTGTEQDYYNGSAHYAAWWTTSAQGFVEQPINEPVAPGDSMSASISDNSGLWTITLSDSTENWSVPEGPFSYSGPGTSAEWIMEAPTVGGRIAPLADYKTFNFDGGTVNGAAPGLTAAEGGEMIQGFPFSQVVSIPSGPDKEASGTPSDGFAIAYGSVQPSAPTSS